MDKAKPLLDPEPAPAALTVAKHELVSVVERLAANPNVDIGKLEKIIELQERILRRDAEAAFNAEFSIMQPLIPVVIERGRTDKGTYAELEDIVEAVRPILGRYGFALSHTTEWPEPGMVRVIGILTHRDGHQRRSEFIAVADTSGSKNAIQALGSTVSYGRRYTTKDLLCIVTRREDDDGRGSSPRTNGNGTKAPEGFDNWVLDLEAVADEGTRKLHETWNRSKQEYRRHLLAVNRTGWETLKRKAAKVKGQPGY